MNIVIRICENVTRKAYAKRHIALYTDQEVERMISGTIDKVSDIAIDEAFQFVLEKVAMDADCPDDVVIRLAVTATERWKVNA